VVADDTDILVLLIYHVTKVRNDIYFVSEAKRCKNGELRPVNVHYLQEQIGLSVCRSFLLLHAFSGCDTTSAIYSHDKGQVLKKIKGLDCLTHMSELMENEHAAPGDIATAGIQLTPAYYLMGILMNLFYVPTGISMQ